MCRSAWISVVVLCLITATALAGCSRQQTITPAGPSSGGASITPEAAPQSPEAVSGDKLACSVCGRVCEPNRVIEVQTAEQELTFCCPVCLASYIEKGKIDPATDSITSHDFFTGDPVSLVQVVIVVGSDVVCPVGRSAVVLGSEESAGKFIAEHGGTKTSWENFLAEQRQR